MRPLLLALAALPLAVLAPAPGDPAAGVATITEEDALAHVTLLAGPETEGRDSPSAGLRLAARRLERLFREAGLEGAGPDGSFLLPFHRDLPAPEPSGCRLRVLRDGEEPVELALGRDFVPLPGCTGEAAGRPIFAGFGIDEKKERWNDLRGLDLRGRIAVIVEGEPRHPRRFDGPEVTAAADVHVKVEALVAQGVAGALVVRRPPEGAETRPRTPRADGADEEPAELGFRHTWAHWNSPEPRVRVAREHAVPVLEVTPAAAEVVLGEDVLALARDLERRGRPGRSTPLEWTVEIASAIRTRSLPIENVVGILRGRDPDLAGEYVVLGAHYDHVGVDPRGRVGHGADDNASGTAALVEILQALAEARPRRSILACAFGGEEDGLLGSDHLARAPPVPRESLVAMLNFDMVGRGARDEVVVLGTKENPALGDVLAEAERMTRARVKAITGKAQHLWQRSDHYSFHRAGVPVLFFFEAASETDNADYHTWRDTIDLVDPEKIARTAALGFHVAWLLAEDDDRPPPPRGSR